MHHRVLVQPQPHTTTQQHLVLSTGQPIGEDVVGVLRKQDVDVHPTARGLDQGALEFPVGDEVGLGEQHPVRGAVQRLQEHRPNRVDDLLGNVALDPEPRVPVPFANHLQFRAAVFPVHVPEVDEGVLQLPDRGAADTHVGVTPLRRIDQPHVVATDEADLTVDGEDLAVVTSGLADVEQQNPGAKRRVAQDVDLGWKIEEGARHHEVGEAVVGDVHLHAPCGRVDESLFELSSHPVVLDDVGLEQHTVACPADLGEHVVVQVDTVGVDRGLAVADRELLRGRVGEDGPLRAYLPSPVVDSHDRGGHGHLGGQNTDESPLDHRPDGCASQSPSRTGRPPHR